LQSFSRYRRSSCGISSFATLFVDLDHDGSGQLDVAQAGFVPLFILERNRGRMNMVRVAFRLTPQSSIL
jgi:hypothetical protein